MPSFPITISAIALVASAAANGATYEPPRLADRRPDLQGNWDHVDATPLERPAGFETLVITAEQAAEIERAIERLEEDRGTPTEPTEYFNERRTNLHQIVQTKDAVVFMAEWMNEARIIRLNARHAPAAVTSWAGDSIGSWEGDTQPRKGETRFMRTSDRVLEYACHEANYSLTYILQGARVRDGQWPSQSPTVAAK